jgi:hypothetical protein
LLVAAATALGRPGQIILLRHAEKPADESNPHLSVRGQERATSLVSLFTNNAALLEHGPPVALFAARPTARRHSQRTLETLAPLAAHLKLPVQTPYSAKAYAALARHVLQQRAFEGNSVVICWVHDSLPQLAEALGVPRGPPWQGHVFDRVWIISYSGRAAKLEDFPQQLLPGDTSR